jgi:hypothetical protein
MSPSGQALAHDGRDVGGDQTAVAVGVHAHPVGTGLPEIAVAHAGQQLEIALEPIPIARLAAGGDVRRDRPEGPTSEIQSPDYTS